MKTECLSLDMANLIKKCPDFTSLRELSAFFHRNTKVNGSNYYFTLCLEEKDAGEAPNILKKPK